MRFWLHRLYAPEITISLAVSTLDASPNEVALSTAGTMCLLKHRWVQPSIRFHICGIAICDALAHPQNVLTSIFPHDAGQVAACHR
jgi:hypothetical protein